MDQSGLLFLDPLLRDCPDYETLAPPATLPKKKKKFNFLKKGASAQDEDEEVTDEVRMCTACKELIDRYIHCIRSWWVRVM